MTSDRISFARTLPIVALLLSYLVIAVAAVVFHTHQAQYAVPHDHALRFSLAAAANGTSRSIQAINLPAFSIELAMGLLNGSFPHGWSPWSVSLLTWRAIAFPIFCLPFWWFVGRGLDALLGDRRLRSSALLAGSVLWVLSLFLLCVPFFGVSAAQREGLIFPYWGCGLWVALLAVFPASWIKNRLTSRRIRTRVQQRLLTGV